MFCQVCFSLFVKPICVEGRAIWCPYMSTRYSGDSMFKTLPGLCVPVPLVEGFSLN